MSSIWKAKMSQTSLFLRYIILTLAAWIRLTAALDDIDYEARGTYFIAPNTTEYPQTYVFALNVVPETGDVYFHMSAYAAIQSNTTAFSWMGIGFGSQMKESLMLIAYPSSNGIDLTISPRIATGHSEPEFQEDIVIEKIFTDAYAPAANKVEHGIMIAHAVCRNCTNWRTGALDLESKRQPFIYALGADPGKSTPLESDDVAASLRRHSFYGHFEGDMTFATTTPEHARVPPPNDPGGSPSGVADTNFAYAFTSEAFDTHSDVNWAPVLHGVLMSLAFILVFPTGALLMRLLRRFGILYHAGVQLVGIAIVIIGFGAGVYISRQYIRSRNFGSGHQILGLLVFAALFVQAGLGLVQHRIFRRTKQETVMGIVHRFFGPTIIVLALVNGGLGLDFAGEIIVMGVYVDRMLTKALGNSHHTIAYGVVVAVVGVLFLSIVGIDRFYRRPKIKKYHPEQQVPGKSRSVNDEDHRAFLTMETPVSAYEMTWMKRDDGVR